MITIPIAMIMPENSMILLLTGSIETMYLTAPTVLPASLVISRVRLIALSPDVSFPFQKA